MAADGEKDAIGLAYKESAAFSSQNHHEARAVAFCVNSKSSSVRKTSPAPENGEHRLLVRAPQDEDLAYALRRPGGEQPHLRIHIALPVKNAAILTGSPFAHLSQELERRTQR